MRLNVPNVMKMWACKPPGTLWATPGLLRDCFTKVKRVAWAGHLVRMNNDRTLKKIFNTKQYGVRSVGRPKLRWEDSVDQDMRILGVKNWKKVVFDSDE